MVQITKNEYEFVFEIKGIHKIWAFRSKIKVLKEDVINAYHKQNKTISGLGWKMPGTYIPGLITAGTFIKNGECNFWDVCNSKNAIVVELKNSSFKKLIIEVKNPTESINLLK